jgi:hypothetical protein
LRAGGKTAASLLVALLSWSAPRGHRALLADGPEKLAEAYAEAVEKLNAEHARKPEGNEDELAKKLPPKALRALDDLLALEKGDGLGEELARAGEAALDLARTADFERVRERLDRVDAARAADLGVALARPRFLLRGIGGLDEHYLEHFADVFDAILSAYDELFGFDEFSKVPGKKVRVRIHLEKEITRPPHFAPQFPWHSEIDFPVVDSGKLRSPTADVRWRSLSKERERLAGVKPSRADADGVLALLVSLHDELGARAIGDALDDLEHAGKLSRVNGVRRIKALFSGT